MQFGLILSHTITTIYVAIFAFFYLIFNSSKIRNAKAIKSILKDILLILLLIAFYLIPLFEHKMYGNYTIFDAKSMDATGRCVYHTAIGFKEWLSSEFSNNEIIFSFGIIITFGILLTPFAYRKAKKIPLYEESILLAIFALFMDSKFFPWYIMPNVFTIIQFAWRLNGFFILFISYVCAINIVTISKMLNDKKNILAIITTICIFICSWFGVKRYMPNIVKDNQSQQMQNIDKYAKDKKFEKLIIEKDKIGPYQINREYLPLNACDNISYIENRENKSLVLDGIAIIENEQKNELEDSMKITVLDKAKVELPYIYYHGYTVKLNGEKIKTYESENGFLCVDIYESGELTVEYTGTVLEKVGYSISVISLIGLIVFEIYNKIKTRSKT